MFHVTTIYGESGWYAEVLETSTGRTVYTTSATTSKMRAEALASAWLSEHDCGAGCCG